MSGKSSPYISGWTNVNRADALRDFFEGTNNAQAAAVLYTVDIYAITKEKDIDGRLWVIWILLQDTAAQLPEYHDKVLTPLPYLKLRQKTNKYS
jgi:hypothetical protein